jgi:hypothetical protein
MEGNGERDSWGIRIVWRERNVCTYKALIIALNLSLGW